MCGGFIEGLTQFFHQDIDFVGGGKRRRHNHRVAGLAHHQAAGVGGIATEDRASEFGARRSREPFVAHQFHRCEHAATAHLADDAVIRQFRRRRWK